MREADGREGAICGRSAHKATGVSPSSFAHLSRLRGKTAPGIIVFLGDEVTGEVDDGDVGIDGLDAQGVGLPAEADVADGD